MQLILYSKPGCHLCEGLQEKLAQITNLSFELEIRDITTRDDWFAAYQYEIPVLHLVTSEGAEKLIPRPSPRLSVERLEKMLSQYIPNRQQNNA
ncbi:glutaredoxin family protein [Dolichospermum sp. ST_con]|nr:glutaredoxin family protein [Dolichospermum sp. ST_con]MDD1421590.1 glutaredoxin family protein [Dolichospermum sp. ST_sed1]MDD1426975.1 glutaredoxin family protein [Dolichospermum sp. ST_sed9]MDD1433655.1 glutaredoxin family protein [Dolichospermum sp. ST_sed6]MDD1442916.1 glutaredoxin family protein [Dolichospermum sp. ST_sed3]MDD1448616.1 glutaredoxin family protein [Dolichospermum sp. ST_sed8]MDD1457172.1 glutaredoxin family protein [Dolichospermum sp. ST_sed7]MDD1462674.1 glutaredoxi